MSVREYIGARYVPLFDGTWDATKNYEPLTVVLYQGNSYTSRQYVPAGTPLTANDYWAETGNFNSQVEAYRQEVLRYTSEIDGMQTSIEGLEADVQIIGADGYVGTSKLANNAVTSAKIADGAVQTADIADDAVTTAKMSPAFRAVMDAQAETLTDLTDAPSVYAYFSGHNAVFFGDSYGVGTAAGTGRYTTLLSNMLNATEFNYCVGGAGFCDQGTGGKVFIDEVDDALAAMSDAQRRDTHLVVVAGGMNDARNRAGSGSEMQAAAANMRNACRSAFPNAIIVCVPMLWQGHTIDATAFNYMNRIERGFTGQAGSAQNTVLIEGAWTWNWGMEANFVSSSSLPDHPNATGHRNIANKIYANILGGSFYEGKYTTISLESGWTSTTNDDGNVIVFENGICSVQGIMVHSTHAEITTNTLLGSIEGLAAPAANMCIPIEAGNKMCGCIIITSSGNVYVSPLNGTTIAANTGFYIGAAAWKPKGHKW